jgi:hypothetical protein
MNRHPAAFAIALFAITGAATASELPPGSGYSIHLDRFNGAVYYTIEHEGYRLVATIADREDGLPVRFVATLTDGQTLAISVPGNLGEPSQLVEFARTGGRLFVNPDSDTDDLVSVIPPDANE